MRQVKLLQSKEENKLAQNNNFDFFRKSQMSKAIINIGEAQVS